MDLTRTELTTTRIPLALPVRGLLVVVLAASGVAAALAGSAGDMPPWAAALAVAVSGAAVVLTATMRHWVVVERAGIVLRFRPFLTRRIGVGEVVAVQMLARAHPLGYGGWGLRLARGGVLALVNRAGPAVRIQPAVGRTCVVVLASEEEAEAVRRRLEQLLGRPVPAGRD
jgi:hypothetical protein